MIASAARRRRAKSSSSLYERYKDALRRGHVAALRGRLEPRSTRTARPLPSRPTAPFLTPQSAGSSSGWAAFRRRSSRSIGRWRSPLATKPPFAAAQRRFAASAAELKPRTRSTGWPGCSRARSATGRVRRCSSGARACRVEGAAAVRRVARRAAARDGRRRGRPAGACPGPALPRAACRRGASAVEASAAERARAGSRA